MLYSVCIIIVNKGEKDKHGEHYRLYEKMGDGLYGSTSKKREWM